MTRTVVGWALLVACAAAPAAASGREETPRVNTTRSASHAVMSVKSSAVTVTQTISPDAFDLRLQSAADEVRITGDRGGHVTVVRGGARHALDVRTATLDDQRTVQRMLSGSAALAGFETLMATPWPRPAAVAPVLDAAKAMIALFRGEAPRALPLVAAMRAPAPTDVPASSLRRVAQKLSPSQCWDIYAHDVLKFTYDLEACMAEASYSLNPLRSAWCGYEYNLKATLAAFWLLDCYGV